MNYKVSFLALACIAPLMADTTGRSFFTARPHFQSASPERVSLFRNDFFDMNINGCGGAVQMVVYGSKSTKPARLAHYFTPESCNEGYLSVKETYTESEGSSIGDADYLKDIDASHFNISTVNKTFESRIYFKPEQTVIGLGLTYRQELAHRSDGRTKFWGELSMPIERISNGMGLTERVINDGGGADGTHLGLDGAHFVNNMVEAFGQSNWHYGKIDSCQCPSKKWGVADIELKFGGNYVHCGNGLCDTFNWSNFIGMVIPTGNRPHGEYMFEPIVGNNHHWGIMAGNSIYIKLWEKDCKLLSLNFDAASKYLFSNHQTRSLDIKGRPWSRYLEMYNSEEQAWIAYNNQEAGSGTSGINLLTKQVKVSPRFDFNLNWALMYSYKTECGAYLLEAGYNFFARQAETIDLESCNLGTIAIKDLYGNGETSQVRTIQKNAQQSSYPINPADYNGSTITGFQRLHSCELDPSSAAHPGVLSYTVYGSMGYQWDNKNHPTLLTIGGSYEFSSEHTNNNIDRWMLWSKFGFSF